MTPWIVDKLCDPKTRERLTLSDAVLNERGEVVEGRLEAPSGVSYPILRGIPRFVDSAIQESVKSFGDEWNYFNFTSFKAHWLRHTVANTFGSTDAFKDRVVVDCGGGSGAQTLWMLESGARHVVMLDLSHSVDDVVQRNLRPSGFTNFDVIQCSIDMPPILPQSIDGIVICHNVIQHTPSVENTARALFDLVADGGEFVFNCYSRNDGTPLRWARHHLVHSPLRRAMANAPFGVTLSYAYAMAALRLVPLLGTALEKSMLCLQGDVPEVADQPKIDRLRHRFRATALNTFDFYGSHKYQHYKSHDEIRTLVRSLQPDESRVMNMKEYFSSPPPIGCALRVRR